MAKPQFSHDPEIYCDACAHLTSHNVEVLTDGQLRSRTVCKECGQEKLGGKIAPRP